MDFKSNDLKKQRFAEFKESQVETMMDNSEVNGWRTLNKCLRQALTLLLFEEQKHFSEHQLIQTLGKSPFLLLDPQSLRDNLGLFRTHFILFHSLYQLKSEWQLKRWGILEISPLLIQFKPSLGEQFRDNAYHKGHYKRTPIPDVGQQETAGQPPEQKTKRDVDKSDPLALYYLDISNLITSTEQSVDEYLNRFWVEFLNPQQKQKALNTLGCSTESTPQEIKKSYRQLAMQHHPDRGGNAHQFHQVQEAYDILTVYN